MNLFSAPRFAQYARPMLDQDMIFQYKNKEMKNKTIMGNINSCPWPWRENIILFQT